MIYVFSNYSRRDDFIIPRRFKDEVDCKKDVMVHLNSCAFLKANIEFFASCDSNVIVTVDDMKSSCLSFMMSHKIVKELIFLGENIKVMPDMSRQKVYCVMSKDDGYVFPSQEDIQGRVLSTGFKTYFYAHHYFNHDDVTLVNFLHDSIAD